ncbi:MAG: hypothetical protein RIF46_02035 [Cyclobacteriaceae bacterium]
MKLERRKAYNPPIKWKESEVQLLLDILKTDGYNADRLQNDFPHRTLAAIRSKVRKLRIKHDLFGESYREEKSAFTIKIAKSLNISTVYDAYAGAGHQTFKWVSIVDTVFASERDNNKLESFSKAALKEGFTLVPSTIAGFSRFTKGSKEVQFYSGDAIKASTLLSSSGIQIDLIDLDTCGSTIPSLSTFLLLLEPKHLVITHGEFHSMRFQREDVIRRLFSHRDITNSILPRTVDEMSIELDKAVKMTSLRAHNETANSFWPILEDETWLGNKAHGMLRRYYRISKPSATSDCINELSE